MGMGGEEGRWGSLTTSTATVSPHLLLTSRSIQLFSTLDHDSSFLSLQITKEFHHHRIERNTDPMKESQASTAPRSPLTIAIALGSRSQSRDIHKNENEKLSLSAAIHQP